MVPGLDPRRAGDPAGTGTAVDEGRAGSLTKKMVVVDPVEDVDLLRALASPGRARMLRLIAREGPMNVNDLVSALGLPQSTVSSYVAQLEASGLIRTELRKARKGTQKFCFSAVEELLVTLKGADPGASDGIEVSMPIGLYTSIDVSAPCGLCTPDGIVGMLDVLDSFHDPDRMRAGLLWFTHGFVEYQFPNNARNGDRTVEAIEVTVELSSEVPGTRVEWPSDITLTLNDTDIGTWTSPGDFGDRRGVLTPEWWKLKGSQYGVLTRWRVGADGTYLNGSRLSDVTIANIDLESHHSIRLRIGVRESARHPGGMNIFGKSFGNHDQDIVMKLVTSPAD